MTDRIGELKSILLEPRPEERRLRFACGLCAALSLWFALALGEPVFLLELPLIAVAGATLAAARRRDSDPGRIEDWF